MGVRLETAKLETIVKLNLVERNIKQSFWPQIFGLEK